MVEFWIDKGPVEFPHACVCCLATGELKFRRFQATKLVSSQKSRSYRIEVPLCKTCLGHTPVFVLRGGCGCLVVTLAAFGLTWGIAALFGLGVAGFGAGALAACLAGLGAYMYFQALGARDFIADLILGKPKRTSECSTDLIPCKLTLECEGFLTDLAFFARVSFTNAEYARRLSSSNLILLRGRDRAR